MTRMVLGSSSYGSLEPPSAHMSAGGDVDKPSGEAQRSGSEAPAMFAGAQGEFAGLDQVNIVVTAAGITSNAVTIIIE